MIRANGRTTSSKTIITKAMSSTLVRGCFLYKVLYGVYENVISIAKVINGLPYGAVMPKIIKASGKIVRARRIKETIPII
jgi:hypothetical protein